MQVESEVPDLLHKQVLSKMVQTLVTPVDLIVGRGTDAMVV